MHLYVKPTWYAKYMCVHTYIYLLKKWLVLNYLRVKLEQYSNRRCSHACVLVYISIPNMYIVHRPHYTIYICIVHMFGLNEAGCSLKPFKNFQHRTQIFFFCSCFMFSILFQNCVWWILQIPTYKTTTWI